MREGPSKLANLRRDRLSVVLCLGAITIGVIGLTGYALGNASITQLGANGKPLPVVTALALIVLGTGLLALRRPGPAGVLMARRAALVVIVIGAADLLLAALSRHLEEWQVWAARGGVNVHAYPFGAFLLITLASALFLITTRRDLTGHVIASAVLLMCAVFFFGYVLSVPSFLEPSLRVLPVAVSTLGMTLIAVAELLARPRGWVVPLLARTAVGMASRRLLAAAIVVPFVALGLRALMADEHWFTPEVGLTVIVVVNVFFGATIVLALGMILHQREGDRARMASIVESSDDAIITTSTAGLIESWNGGAERMCGYTAAEAVGHSVTMLAPPERQEEAPQNLERILRGERIDPFETVRVAKDGRHVNVRMSVSPVLDDAGNVIGFSSIAHDITQRKQELEALRISEERLRLVQQAACIGHFFWDIQTNITTRSDEMLALYGLPPGSLGGRHEDWRARIFPADLAAVEAAIQAALASGELSQYFRVVWPDASIHWLHARGKVMFSDDGKPLRVVGINMDITERMRTEEALRRSEATLKEAQRIAHIGHWDRSAVTGAVTWSDEVYRILGIPDGSVTPSYELFLGKVHPEDRRRAEDEIARLFSRGGVCEIHGDLRINTEAGAEVIISQHVFADRDAAGNVVGLHGTCQDITARVATEQALRASEARYRQLFEANPHPMWVYDLETLAFLEVNDAAVAGYGFLRDEFLAMTIVDIRPSADAAKLQVHLSAVGNCDLDDAGNWKHRTKDGAIIDVEITSHRLVYGGRRAELVLAFDITERLRADEALRDSEAALAEAQQIAHIGSWILDPESGEATVSAETFKIFGIEPRAVVRVPMFFDLIHEEDRARVAACVTASLDSGRVEVEFRTITPRGLRVVHAIARRQETVEPHFKLIGTIQDITERKAAEESLRQHTESLERYTSELERFNRLAVGRELRMIELKQQINDLCVQSGQPAAYVLPDERAFAKETA